MLRMKVKAVGIDRETLLPVVILTDYAEKSYVPLVIGPAEANSIALALESIEPPRPLTHDLLLNTILSLDAKIDKVTITDLDHDVFYAEIGLIKGGTSLTVDARPSDAIALALRSGVSIFVDEKIVPYVMALSGDEDPEMEQFRSFLKDLSPDDFRKEN